MLQPNEGSILSILQLSRLRVEQIVASTHKVLARNLLPERLSLPTPCIVGLIFEQASHRTKNSFYTAATCLGASVLDLSETYRESCLRGESLSDFCHTAECYVDCLVVRSASSTLVAEIHGLVQVPVINAGNGRTEHPTQALADLSVMCKHFGHLEKLKISMVGCLRDSRCANSLALLLAPFQVRISMICPAELALTQDYQLLAEKRGATFQHRQSFTDALTDDVLYFTSGTLAEDFANDADYQRYRQWFTWPPGFLSHLSPHAIMLHPLPRGSELPRDVDQDVRLRIFEQVRHGLAVRKVILSTALGANF